MSELIAKTVLGEITLGEVFRKFEDRISHVVVEHDDREVECTSWIVEDGHLQFVGDWEVECEFSLDEKVKVRDNFLEIEGYTFWFVESKDITFESLLPEKPGPDG